MKSQNYMHPDMPHAPQDKDPLFETLTFSIAVGSIGMLPNAIAMFFVVVVASLSLRHCHCFVVQGIFIIQVVCVIIT